MRLQQTTEAVPAKIRISWRRWSVVRSSVFDWRTFPDLRM